MPEECRQYLDDIIEAGRMIIRASRCQPKALALKPHGNEENELSQGQN